MPLLRPINLPASLIVQSVSLVGLGLYLTFFRRPPFTSAKNGYSLLVPANPSPRLADTITVLGIAVVGLESAYLVLSYMPLEENQFVHASVPIRLFISGCLAAVCTIYRKTMSTAGFFELMGLAIVDGSAAVALGLQLGRFDGMVKGADRWL